LGRSDVIDTIDISVVDAIVAGAGRDRTHLIPILLGVQRAFNYLPEVALRRVAEMTDNSPAAIMGVATFYSQFRLTPAGLHRIKVCIGTACHVKGADSIVVAFRHYLGIPDDEDTDADKLFTVEPVACLGCCMLAPAVQIDTVTYGYLSPEKVPGVLRDFLASEGRGGGDAAQSRSPRGEGGGEVRICQCSSCAAAGSVDVRDAFLKARDARGLPVAVKAVGCTGVSFEAPLVEIAPTNGATCRYGRVEPDAADAILMNHFSARRPGHKLGRAAVRLLEELVTGESDDPIVRHGIDLGTGHGAAYWGRQHHIVMQHCGELDPLDLDAYRGHGGFDALKRCASGLSPETVVTTVYDSGLRGRGGAGFPTGKKWRTVREASGEEHYVVCNGDEGDPGSFMDRMILESFPFRVIEGMAVAAHAVGASRGFLYIRGEYPVAIERVSKAIALCEAAGLTGPDAGPDGIALRLEVVEGAGAFVCGEETALIAAIEGGRGTPRVRPPYPAEKGLWGQPTLVNNVETFTLVPWIILHGAEPFSSLGTHGSKGTKSFALAGKVERGGLIEVPMGISLREIVEDIGGGVLDGHTLKAVQVGGPSGGCVPARLADTPVDYDALVEAGAIMGSGGLVVLDETDCMVDIARYFLSFTQLESCGKCTYCRVGTKRMLEIMDRLCAGEAAANALEELETLAHLTQRGSLCGLGKTAPNPVLSTLQHFREEYEAHLEGRCPAGKCKALIRYVVTDDCIGCTRCAQRCPVDAIPSIPYHKHKINDEICIRCDTCRQVCPSDAIEITDAKT
jgi:NADH-quinone oxidoreductase subunit F